MKKSDSPHISSPPIFLQRMLAAFTLAILALTAFNAPAANRWWDGPNDAGAGDGIGQGGSANWGSSNTNWDQGAGLSHTNWVNGANDTAIFEGTGGTVNVTHGSGVQVAALIFQTNGYTLSGSRQINLGNAGLTDYILVATNSTATINTVINGGPSTVRTLQVGGRGTLVLNATNTFDGQIIIGNNAPLAIFVDGTGSGQTTKVQASIIKNLGVASSLGQQTTVARGTIQIGDASTSAILEYTGTNAASTDRKVQVGSSSSGSGGSSILNNSTNDAYTLTFSNPAFNPVATIASSSAFNRTLTLGGSNAGPNTIAGVINNNTNTSNASGGRVGVTKNGSGTWVLSGDNIYSGATTVTAGTLLINGDSSGASGAVTVANGAIFGGTGIVGGVVNYQSGSLANFTITPTAATAYSNTTYMTFTKAAFLTNVIVNVNMPAGLGNGDYVLATNYAGFTTSGILTFATNSGSLGTGGSGVISVSGNNLILTVSGVTGSYGTPIKADNTTNLNLAASWVGGIVPGAGDIAQWDNTVTSANSTFLGADLSWSGIKILNPGGLVTINAGNTLTVGASGIDLSLATNDLTLNCGVVQGAANIWSVTNGRTLTVGGVVSGSGSLSKQGDGTLILTNVNTFTGGLTNEAGTLKLGGASGNVIPNAAVVTLSGGSLDLNDTSDTIGRLVVSGSVTMTSSGGGTGVLTSAYTSTAQGATAASAYFTLASGKFSSKYWVNNGITTIAGGTLELNQAGSEVLNGYNTAGAVFTLNSGLVNAQQVSCGNSNSTYHFNGGMVQCGIIKIRGPGAFDLFFNGTTLQPWISSYSLFIPSYSPSYGTNVNFSVQPGQNAWISTNGIIVDTSVCTNPVPVEIAIDLQHDPALGVALDGGFTKIGTGGLILSSNATYTGSTVVSGGTLYVNGAISTSPVTVQASGTLGGTGTIGGTVTVNSGGTLAPGASIGTLTLNGNVVLNAGSTNTFEVNGTTPANDQVVLGGSVTYGGVLKIVPSGTFTNGQTFTLFSGAGATSASNFSSISSSGGTTFSFTNGILTVVSVGSAPTPVIGTVTVSGGNLQGLVPSTVGYNYVLQTTTNLTPPVVWTSLSTNAGTGANLPFSVPVGPEPEKFVRFWVY